MSLHTSRSGEDSPCVPSASSSTTSPSEYEQDTAHLLRQQHLLNALIGGPLPPDLSLPGEGRVLDVGCGGGTWVYEMAHRYPSLQIIGVDTNITSIQQARQLNRHQPNTLFLLQDMAHLEGTIFAPEAFILIHLRFLASDISYERFPPLIQSLAQLLKVGGRLISCEAELPLTSSRACDYLEFMLLSALITRGQAFSQGFALRIGMMAWIQHWFRLAGLLQEDELSYMLPISYGTAAHEIFCQQATISTQRISSYLQATRVLSQERCEEVSQQMQKEIEATSFCGVWPIHLLVAVKQQRQELRQYAYAENRHEVKVSA